MSKWTSAGECNRIFSSRLWKTRMSVLRIKQKNQTGCSLCSGLRGHMSTKGDFILRSVRENKHRSALFSLLCLLTSVYLKWKGFWLNSCTITIERGSFNRVYLFEGCSLHFCPLPFKVLSVIPKAQVKPAFLLILMLNRCMFSTFWKCIWSPLVTNGSLAFSICWSIQWQKNLSSVRFLLSHNEV